MHGISEGRAVAVEDHQPEAPAPGSGATAPNAPAPEADAPAPEAGAPATEAAGPGAPDTDAVGAAGSVPWGADSIVAPGTEPIPDPAVDSPPDAAAGARGPRSTTTPHKKTARRGRKPAIIRAKDPLTRKTLASALDNTDLATTDHAHSDNAAREDASDSPATSESPTAAQTPVLGQLETLWDTGMAESTQYATKLRDVAALAPQADDLDLRDEAEYLIAQALRTTIHHAGRLLADARTATTHLPQLLALLDTGTLSARWFTFILRRSSTLTPTTSPNSTTPSPTGTCAWTKTASAAASTPWCNGCTTATTPPPPHPSAPWTSTHPTRTAPPASSSTAPPPRSSP